jgi:chemotaxis response regulator CheB
VIGGSAGSIEVLRPLLARLPSDFAAPVCIAIHALSGGPGIRLGVATRYA